MKRRKSPKPKRAKRPTRRNPRVSQDARDLAAARRLSQEINGTPSEVVELSPAERVLPRFMARMGKAKEVVYSPRAGTTHGNADWRHRMGDRGPLENIFRPASRKPDVLVNPKNRRPVILGGDVKVDPKKGMVG